MLPRSPGLEDVPQVIPRAAAIEDGYIEIQIMHTSRFKRTIPMHAPVALLDSEYLVHGCVDPDALTNKNDPTDYYAALADEQRAVVDAVTIDHDKRLQPAQLERVRQLVAEHVAAFAVDPK